MSNPPPKPPVKDRSERRNRRGRSQSRAPLRLIIPQEWRLRSTRTESAIQSLYHAITGLAQAFERERNMKIHCVSAVLVVVAAVCLHVDLVGWALLAIAIGIVITTELINTAVERLVDLASEGTISRLAREAKDIAAGAVLLSALVAIAIGAAVFGPRVAALVGW